MLDVSVSYSRYRFLGPEFLTYLWYLTESDPDAVTTASDGKVSLALGRSIVLENRRRDDVERVTIKGDEAQMDEAMLALKKGAVVTQMHLNLEIGEMTWSFSVRGEDLAVTGLKTPPGAPLESPDELEAAILDKAALCEKPLELVDGLFQRFIRLRVSDAWHGEVIPAMRRWLDKTPG